MIRSFEVEIKKGTGWSEKLGYIPRDDFDLKSRVIQWETGPITHTLAVQVTPEPAASTGDTQVCFPYFSRGRMPDLDIVPRARRRCVES